MDTAEDEDLVRAGKVHGGDGRVGYFAGNGRRTPNDVLDARHFGREDGHVGRCHQRVATPRDVGADGIERVVPLAEMDAGLDLNLKVTQRVALCNGEFADVGLYRLDVVEGLLWHGSYGRLDALLGELEGRRGPLVELLRVSSNSRVAVLPDRVDDILDDGGHVD